MLLNSACRIIINGLYWYFGKGVYVISFNAI